MPVDYILPVMRRLLALGVLALAGCGVDPLPEPPAAPKLVGDVVTDACPVCDGQTRIHAGPGSVVDADTIWVADLDQPLPIVTAPVANDGSFEVFFDAIEGDELRLQARRGDLRSAPVDLLMPASGVLEPAPRPLADCFTLAAELALDDTAVAQSSTATIRVEHTCSGALTVDSIALRAPSADLGVSAPGTPLVLAPGDFVDVAIDFHPTTTGLREEVLIVEVSAPAADRRAVTLFGRGHP